MGLEWTDRVDGVNTIIADDVNRLAGAILENESNIARNAEEISSKASDNDVTALKENVDDISDRLDKLESLTISYEEIETLAYKITVPNSSAEKAVLNYIAGKTYMTNNLMPEVLNFNHQGEYNAFSYEIPSLSAGIYIATYRKALTEGEIGFFELRVNGELLSWGVPFEINDGDKVTIEYELTNLTVGSIFVMLNSGIIPLPYEEPLNPRVINAKITDIISKDSDDVIIETYTIPTEIQGLIGYGKGIDEFTNNFVNFDTKEFNKVIGEHQISLDEISLASDLSETYGVVYYQIPKPNDDLIKGVSTGNTTGFRCDGFFYKEWVEGVDNFNTSDNVGRILGNANNDYYWFGFPSGTTLGDAIIYLEAKTLRYTLKETIKTDISQYLSEYEQYKDIRVSAGGNIIFENENKFNVPIKVTYAIKK